MRPCAARRPCGRSGALALAAHRSRLVEVAAADALAYVDAVTAAFELVDDHGADYARLAAAPLVADNAWNAGLVLGPAAAPGGPGSLKDLKGVLTRNGEVVDEGTSSDVLG